MVGTGWGFDHIPHPRGGAIDHVQSIANMGFMWSGSGDSIGKPSPRGGALDFAKGQIPPCPTSARTGVGGA